MTRQASRDGDLLRIELDALKRAGAYAQARDRAQLAVDDLTGAPGREGELGEALVELGRAEEDLGRYPASEVAYQRAIAVCDGIPGAAEPLLAATGQLTLITLFLSSPARAASMAERVSELAVAVPESPELSAALASAAIVRADAGDDAGAQDLVGQARAGLRYVPAGTRRVRASVAVGIAEGHVHRVRGRYSAAAASLRDSLARATSGLGSDAIEVVGVLNELGMTCKFAGWFEEGEQSYRRSLDILERIGGRDHPDLAALYHNLGGLAHARGDHAVAEPLARRGVEIRERALGRDHPVTLRDRAAHASILDALRRSEEAEAILREAIAGLSDSLGEDHPEVAVNLNNLAAILGRRGELEAAAAMYERALTIKERSVGPVSPSLAITLTNLATVRRRQGRLDDAERLYRRALSTLDREVDPGHPARSAATANLTALERYRAAHGPRRGSAGSGDLSDT